MDDHGGLCVLYIVYVFRDYDRAWLRVIARESHGAEHISAHIVCAGVCELEQSTGHIDQ